MKDFTVSLKQDVPHIITFPGSAFHIQDASSFVTLRFDNGDAIKREKTQGGTVGRFQRVELLSAVDQMVTVTIGDGLSIDGRAQVVGATINTTISPSDTVINSGDVVAGASATLIAAANANRKEIEICLPSTATDSVRIGNAGVAASSGSILEVGSSKVFGCEAALYVIRTGSVDETVTVLELERA